MLGYILWGVIIVIVLFFLISQLLAKKKAQGMDLTVDPEWLAKSKSLYPEDEAVHRYYMHPDKHLSAQGHLIEDADGNPVYEEKLLAATLNAPYEVDMVNHIINYTHHHQMTHPTTISGGIGGEDGTALSLNFTSRYELDGINVWKYIREKGYGYKLGIAGAGYTVTVTENDEIIGKLYSAANGKQLTKEGEITPVIGMSGSYILECKNRNIDGLVLVAIAFSRCELSLDNLRG